MENEKYFTEQTFVVSDREKNYIKISYDEFSHMLISIKYVNWENEVFEFPPMPPLFAKAMAEAILKHELVRGAGMV